MHGAFMYVLGFFIGVVIYSGKEERKITEQCEKQGSFMVGDRVYDCKPREVK